MPMTLIIQRVASRHRVPACRVPSVPAQQRCVDALVADADRTLWPTHRLRACWADARPALKTPAP